MEKHSTNLFEIINLSELGGFYRTYEVKNIKIDWREDESQIINLNNLVKLIAFENKIPVALLLHNDYLSIAIPVDKELEKLEYALTPDVLTLNPTERVKEINFKNLDPESKHVALSFLRFALQTPLIKDNSLWKSGSSFFTKRPINWNDDNRETDVYGGFGFKLLSLDRNIYVAVRLCYKYVDRKWLTDRCPIEKINDYKMRHALYHFGHKFFPVQLLGITGKSISEQKFKPENIDSITTVFEYTKKEAGTNPPQWILTLNPSSPAINYRYPGNEKKRYGAATLCKLILPTDDPNTSHLHPLSIKPPHKRLSLSQDIVKLYLNKGNFNGAPIKVSDTPLSIERKVFQVPAQLFGQNAVLEVNGKGISLDRLGKTRMEYLRDPNIGGLITSGFDAQYLLAPLSLNRQIVEDFKNRLEKSIQQFVHGSYSMELILYDDLKAKTLKEQSEAILGKCINLHGYAVLILPSSSRPADLHNFIKKKLWPKVQCQCVLAESLSNFYHRDSLCKVKRDLKGKYISYLRYTALGYLMVNRKWLWALRDKLHYDAYIGVDVLNNTAAFTFLYNNGLRCFTHIYPSKQKEKLLPQQIREVIYKHLKADLGNCNVSPQSIIIHRDGRAYLSEWRGFQDAIEQLQRDKVLPESVVIGIVEVHKHNSYGFRLFLKEKVIYRNPIIGSWEMFGEDRGIVCTTGEPFKLPGTANPLYIQIAYGKLDIRKVLQDIFSLSQLCWMNPEGCCRLPITVKLCDEFLNPVAAEADEDEAIYGEIEEIEEINDKVIILEERRIKR